jgi:hypothetical protein
VYHLEVAPVNVTRALVRIVVSGDEEAIDNFHKEVIIVCKDELQIPESSISLPQEYKGLEPDWQSFYSMFTAEQAAKSVVYLQRTYAKLENIEEKFGTIGTTLTSVSNKLDSLVNSLAPVSEINNSLVEMNKTLKLLIEKLKDS